VSGQPIPRITPEQYLEADRAAPFRSEYYNGHVCAIAGGTFLHAHLIANVITELNRVLGDRPCVVASSQARLRISAGGPFVYPDVLVMCGPIEYADGRKDVVVNPSVVVEVLSKSTEGHDRGAKFAYYRRIESLQEYILVSQTAARVEVFRRKANGTWELSDYVGLDAAARLESIDVQITLAGIYKKVTFPLEEGPSFNSEGF
jgi:Uma2 family endonuclease